MAVQSLARSATAYSTPAVARAPMSATSVVLAAPVGRIPMSVTSGAESLGAAGVGAAAAALVVTVAVTVPRARAATAATVRRRRDMRSTMSSLRHDVKIHYVNFH